MKRVVIIGGGISGLAAANRLIERSDQTREPIHLTLLEASPLLGGVIRSEHRDGFLIEAGPDSFISEKPQAFELAERLGLASDLIETNSAHRRSFIVRGGRLRAVPEGFHLLAPSLIWPFLASDILSLSGKARLALDLFLPRKSSNGEDESLASFVRRRLGREALERVAQPMVGGIYTADPEQLSLRATMPRFLEMEQQHRSLIRAMWKNSSSLKQDPGRSPTFREGSGARRTVKEGSGISGARYSLFLSFENGMQTLVDRLAERISNFKFQISDSQPNSDSISNLKSQISNSDWPNPSIRLNTQVEALALDGGHVRPDGKPGSEGPAKWNIRTSAGETITADAVCLALPAFAAARLLRDVDFQLALELEAIPYASTATINLSYKREDIPHPLNGFGFVVPFIERRTVMACTFSSVKFAGRAPADKALLRAFVGGALQPEMFGLEEGEMVREVRVDLRELLGIERPPLFAQVARWPNSMPQYHLGHLDRVKRIEQLVDELPGLALAGNAYAGPGIPDCIRSGETAAETLGSEDRGRDLRSEIGPLTSGLWPLAYPHTGRNLIMDQPTFEIEQQLRQMNDDWLKALVHRDGETLQRIMADDFFFTYPLEGDDKTQFISDVTSGDLTIEHITRHHLSVRVFGSTAVLTVRDTASWKYKGRALKGQYKIIQVYSERAGRWQLVAVQACPMS